MSVIDSHDRVVRRQSGADVIYKILRDDIISGRLAPGSRLLEAELSASLGASRTPVREALRLLLGDHLVEQRSGGGFRVAPLDVDDVRRIYTVRALLEGQMASDACLKITDAHLEALRELIDQMSLLRDHDREVARIGAEFHGLIERIADNRWCLQPLQQLRGHIERFRALSTEQAGRPAEALAAHEAIYAALRARDADAAGAAMRDHITRGAEFTVRALAVPDETDQPGETDR